MEPGLSASTSRGLSFFLKLATATLVVVVLAQARPVLMPIAFVLVLSFILSGPMKRLHGLGLPKVVALGVVMIAQLSALAGSAYVLADQLSGLTRQLTGYNESMRRKVSALQSGGSGPLDRLQRTVEKITEGLEPLADGRTRAEPVRLVATEVSAAERLQRTLTPLAEPLAHIVIVLVMCIFVLGGRDDLRNRLIRLVGPKNLTATTRALDEGAQRISRYLVDQTLINVGFGLCVGAGLWLLGVPYAALWGGIAALFRYIPYIGAMASMLMPATLAFAIFPGWQQTLLTIALFIGLDVITAYFVEPMIIGHRTGVSSIALLFATLFWTWLWGPLGLVLSTPLTVSLAVLSRHIPPLQFLAVLLGDEPVIGAEISFYQRLLARDEDEASEVAQKQIGTSGAEKVMDEIIVPTLALATRDRNLKEITAEDLSFLLASTRDIVERLNRGAPSAQVPSSNKVLLIAANGAESELLLEMLAKLVAPTLGELSILSADLKAGALLAQVEASPPDVICIGFLPPDGGAPARQLCRRLKAVFPKVKLLALRPNDPGGEPTRSAARLREAGADGTATNLAEAAAELTRLLSPNAELAA